MALSEASLSRTGEFVKMFAEFPLALRRYLRDRPALGLAEQRARARIEARPEALLRLLERSIYGVPASPYRALLKRAGCELGDARALVRDRGVDGALRALRAEGVYVTYEEFKGRKPIVRGGLELAVGERDFDNPGARRSFSLSTGGSTGLANKVFQDLDHIAALATFDMLTLAEHDMLDAPTVHWTHMLPGSGIRFILRRAYHGDYRQDWFTPLGWRADRARLKDQLGTFYMLCCMRACGIRAAFPREAEPAEAIVVARRMRRVLDAAGRCLLYANVSQAVRAAVAAEDAGFDLAGAAVFLSSEPLTQAKAERIERAGIRIIAGYGSVETGAMGLGCARRARVDEVHLAMDAYALIDHPYEVPSIGVTVPAFNLTGLLDSAPKVMLNYQSDDYGDVADGPCGCGLEVRGYTTRLSNIRSYSKLVGEGVTLIGNELLRVIEDVLPARFGGSPLDYQFMEREDAGGMTRLVLCISPKVALPDEAEAVRAVLDALARSSPMAASVRAVWQQAGTIQIERREPVATARGKVLPLHIDRD